MYTPYAAQFIGKQEHLATWEDVGQPTPEGNDTWLVIHQTRKGERRYHVDIKNNTCGCYHSVAALMPCLHEIVVHDFLKLRDTEEKMLKFRKEYVAPFFWSENYIDAYQGLCVQSPILDLSRVVKLNPGDRQIMAPLFEEQEKPKCKRGNKKRQDRSVNLKRSRAIWDRDGYVARKRTQSGKNGPRNPFVIISKPDTFKRDPRGRKGKKESRVLGSRIVMFLCVECNSHVTHISIISTCDAYLHYFDFSPCRCLLQGKGTLPRRSARVHRREL